MAAMEHSDSSLLYVAGAGFGVMGSLSSILMSKLSGRQVVATMISAIFLGSMTGPFVMYMRPDTPMMVAGGCGFIMGFMSLFIVPAGMKSGEKITAKLFGLAEKKLGLPEVESEKTDGQPGTSVEAPKSASEKEDRK